MLQRSACRCGRSGSQIWLGAVCLPGTAPLAGAAEARGLQNKGGAGGPAAVAGPVAKSGGSGPHSPARSCAVSAKHRRPAALSGAGGGSTAVGSPAAPPHARAQVRRPGMLAGSAGGPESIADLSTETAIRQKQSLKGPLKGAAVRGPPNGLRVGARRQEGKLMQGQEGPRHSWGRGRDGVRGLTAPVPKGPGARAA